MAEQASASAAMVICPFCDGVGQLWLTAPSRQKQGPDTFEVTLQMPYVMAQCEPGFFLLRRVDCETCEGSGGISEAHDRIKSLRTQGWEIIDGHWDYVSPSNERTSEE